jgi:hypothetical protein
VGAVVVHDQVDLQMRGDFLVDPAQELLGGVQCLQGRAAISTTTSHPGPEDTDGERPAHRHYREDRRRPSSGTTTAVTSAGRVTAPGPMFAHTFLAVTAAWTAAIWAQNTIPPRSAHRGGSPPNAGQLLLHTDPARRFNVTGAATAAATKGRYGPTAHASYDALVGDSTQPSGRQAPDRAVSSARTFRPAGPAEAAGQGRQQFVT